MPYLRTVWPNGGSLCISLPCAYCRSLHWAKGDVTIVGMQEGGEIVVKKLPISEPRKEDVNGRKPAKQFPFHPDRSN